MKLLLTVCLGSFVGGGFRYMISTLIQHKAGSVFPYATLAINLIGCLIIGCLIGLSAKWNLNFEWRMFIATGLLGGFTTFSAFSLESSHLLRTGHIWMAILYIAISVIAGISLTLLGGWLFRSTAY